MASKKKDRSLNQPKLSMVVSWPKARNVKKKNIPFDTPTIGRSLRCGRFNWNRHWKGKPCWPTMFNIMHH